MPPVNDHHLTTEGGGDWPICSLQIEPAIFTEQHDYNLRPTRASFEKLVMRPFLAAALIIVPQVATAQDASDDFWNGRITDIDFPCQVHFSTNATKVVLRVTTGVDGSFAEPLLVGLKDTQVSWTKRLPHAQQINAAKSEVDCLASNRRFARFSIGFENPGDDHSWHSQNYEWNGSAIKYLGGTHVMK